MGGRTAPRSGCSQKLAAKINELVLDFHTQEPVTYALFKVAVTEPGGKFVIKVNPV